MASHCRNVRAKKPGPVSSNKFEVLKIRVMQRGKGSDKKVAKDRREILREEKAKKGVDVKIVDGGLYFIFHFHFILLFFSFSFNFLFLEQLGLGVISHAVTSVTKLMA